MRPWDGMLRGVLSRWIFAAGNRRVGGFGQPPHHANQWEPFRQLSENNAVLRGLGSR